MTDPTVSDGGEQPRSADTRSAQFVDSARSADQPRSADVSDQAREPGPTGRTGVLLMAYGTPRSPDEIEPYYTDIRRGRPPTPEALADLTARYAAIGGVSPLATLTEAQRDGLQAALDDAEPGRFHVALGLKHAAPKVETGAADLVETGVDSIVGLVLAPHYSAYSIGQYLQRTRDGVAETGRDVAVHGIESWATEPAFVEFLANDLAERVDTMRAAISTAGGSGRVRVAFTAHSLPQRIIDEGDPYPDELRSTAEAVAARVGLAENVDWVIGWQSAGRTPEPWIGPDILALIDDLGADPEIDGLIVCACGFVADHLEVLYDLDIEARRRADAHGLSFDRTACVNDNPAVMSALARRVITAAN